MTPDPATAKQVPRQRLLEFLGEMLLIRRFEEAVIERFRAGELAGFLHACIGQEADRSWSLPGTRQQRRDGIDTSRTRTCDRQRDAAE